MPDHTLARAPPLVAARGGSEPACRGRPRTRGRHRSGRAPPRNRRRDRAADAHLVPAVAVPFRDAEREVVEQLVREHDRAARGERGHLLDRGEHRARARFGHGLVLVGSGARTDRAPRRPARAAAGRAARPATPRSVRRARSATPRRHAGAARNTSRARRPLPAPASTTRNGSGSLERVPQPVEGAGHAGAEERADLGARDEVAARRARLRGRARRIRRRRRGRPP